MAKAASADQVKADMAPPDYRGAVDLMRNKMKKLKDAISGKNGEISQVWDTIEGKKVDKRAGRIFLTLDNMEKEDRHSAIQSLQGLIEASGWESMDDLVDRAEGTVVKFPNVGRQAEDTAADESAAEDEPTSKPAKRQPKSTLDKMQAATAKARKHIGGNVHTPPQGRDVPEPYTGDNSDLSDDDETGPAVH